MTKQELINQFYFEDGERYIKIQFQTPTAFKRQGNYEFYPDLQLIYQSLMNKYDLASTDDMVKSDELLEELLEYSRIIQYNLRSCYFPMGRAKIPAFMGTMTVKITGPQGMVNFANMLFQFGTYSGVGIKTAIGMGSIEILRTETTM